MSRVGILGTGLIGASLGMALRQAGWKVAGWDPNPEALAMAADRGALDEAAGTESDACAGAELIVLAGPLEATCKTLASLESDALVTDVAGVKVPVLAAARSGLRLVAGHPMAGREHAGPGAATAALFRGAAWIVCPDGAAFDDLRTVVGMVESVGATPVEMPAAEHDRVVAMISHLPQMIATSLVNEVASHPEALGLVSGSFRDLTRVAASEPGWWPDVLSANRDNVEEAIDGLVERLRGLRSSLGGDVDNLSQAMASARDRRRDMAPPTARVRVVLQDRPGEIAGVGRALESSGVDVRDLQLRHAIHGGGGVLTLSVRDGDEQPLRSALAGEGFILE